MKILRNTDEWVGLLVLTSIALFVAAALHAGLLSDWFRPTARLRVLLPETGSAGLAAGADIQVLGTHVGTVRHIVVDPTQRMYAEAELEQGATGFIRHDSQAVLKKTFGVAGATFLDITRGTGAPLDWQFAVIDAASERDPTESIGAVIDQVKQKMFPILDDVGRATKALADTTQGISEGHGDIGRFVKDEELFNQRFGRARQSEIGHRAAQCRTQRCPRADRDDDQAGRRAGAAQARRHGARFGAVGDARPCRGHEPGAGHHAQRGDRHRRPARAAHPNAADGGRTRQADRSASP